MTVIIYDIFLPKPLIYRIIISWYGFTLQVNC